VGKIKVLFFVAIAMVTVLSIIHIGGDGPREKGFDSHGYFKHALAYLVTATFGLFGFRQTLRIGLFVAVYGAFLEFVQLWVPDRTFNWWDMAFNVVGVVLAFVLWYLWRRIAVNPGKQSAF
jgi:VanZ family protein